MFDIPTILPLIPALPLAATLVTAVLGKRVLKHQSHWPTILALGAACALAVVLLLQVNEQSQAVATAGGGEAAAAAETDAAGADAGASAASVGFESVHVLWTWVDISEALGSSDFRIEVALRADPLTALMLVMVTFVATLVAIYSVGYMHDDPGYWRFFTYVSLFVFSMTMLVSVSNFVLLFVFWEAVGVCSYLLIGFWFHKPEAAAAGKKAFLVNRVGDFAFTLGVFLIWTTFGTLDFHDRPVATAAGNVAASGSMAAADGAAADNEAAAAGSPVYGVLGQHYLANGYADVDGESGKPSQGVLLAICLLLFAGACGKSAQFPLHVWLPDAMEGPTPVSALIHAATMVTAGVYLVARTAPLFLESGSAFYVVAIIGGLTAFFSAIIAVTQTDLKRVLAYSTVSQLGYMFLALGTCTLAGFTAGMFHLFTHAAFKALLFLGAGSVMHAMGGVIDMRHFGGLRRLMPYTHWTFLAGGLALAGLLPFAGFWSKDAILSATHEGHPGGIHWIYEVLYWMGTFAALLTAFYTFRAFFRTFYGKEVIPPEAGHHAHESPKVMVVPLVILAVLAAGAGFMGHAFAELLGRTPSLSYSGIRATGPAEQFHLSVAIVSTAVAVAGIGLAALLYLRGGQLVASLTAVTRSTYLYQLSYGKFFVDQIYSLLVVGPLWVLAYLFAFLDRLLVDGLVNLLGWIPQAVGSMLRPLQIGLVQFYALAMVLGVLVLIGSLLW